MKIENILVRIYVSSEDIENEISFYENLTCEKAVGRFKFEEKNLDIVRVGGFLIIAGSEEALESFRDTSATIRVDNLQEVKDYIIKNGGQVIEDIKKVPTGENMIMCHKDGTVIEYVQHNLDTRSKINNLDKFLKEDEYIDYSNDSIKELAEKLSYGINDKVQILAYKNRPELDEYFIKGIYAEPDIETMKMLEKAPDTDYVLKNILDKPSIKPDILE